MGMTRSGFLIALAGNPNTGKSTLFNALTGLNQHTGNWPGKTVLKAEGVFRHQNRKYHIVDLPGTYSLMTSSAEEDVARDFICFAHPDATIVVADATSLERNLNLALQVLEITSRVVVCVNLIDEAERKKIRVDVAALAKELGVPAVAASARSGLGLPRLKDAIHDIAVRNIPTSPRKVQYSTLIEEAVQKIESRLGDLFPERLNRRWVALRLLEGDQSILNTIHNNVEDNLLEKELAKCVL